MGGRSQTGPCGCSRLSRERSGVFPAPAVSWCRRRSLNPESSARCTEPHANVGPAATRPRLMPDGPPVDSGASGSAARLCLNMIDRFRDALPLSSAPESLNPAQLEAKGSAARNRSIISKHRRAAEPDAPESTGGPSGISLGCVAAGPTLACGSVQRALLSGFSERRLHHDTAGAANTPLRSRDDREHPHGPVCDRPPTQPL